MYTLLIAKLVGCGGCERFNSLYRNELIEALEDESRLQILEMVFGTSGPSGIKITDARTGDAYTKSITPNIRDHIGWFPTFVLVKTSDLISNDSIPAIVFNSKIVEGTPKPAGGPMNASALEMWIVDELDNAKEGRSTISESSKESDDKEGENGYFCNDSLFCKRKNKITDHSRYY